MINQMMMTIDNDKSAEEKGVFCPECDSPGAGRQSPQTTPNVHICIKTVYFYPSRCNQVVKKVIFRNLKIFIAFDAI